MHPSEVPLKSRCTEHCCLDEQWILQVKGTTEAGEHFKSTTTYGNGIPKGQGPIRTNVPAVAHPDPNKLHRPQMYKYRNPHQPGWVCAIHKCNGLQEVYQPAVAVKESVTKLQINVAPTPNRGIASILLNGNNLRWTDRLLVGSFGRAGCRCMGCV